MSGQVDGIGTIVTGGIAAREIDRAANPGGVTHGHAGAGSACLNCGAIRAGDYCQDCGQSGHTHRHVMAIGHDIAHGVFHFEGKFWSTLPLLILKPGELTRRYVHGERARFVSPMALFLFSVFLLFAAVNRIAIPGDGTHQAREQIADQTERANDALSRLKDRRVALLDRDPKADTTAIDRRIATTEQGIVALNAAAAHLPVRSRDESRIEVGDETINTDLESGIRGMTVDTGSALLDRQLEHVKHNPSLYAYKLKMASYKYSWALIPISVPFIWLMFFWRRDVGLYDHAIFAIYSLSFMTLLAVALIGLDLLGVPEGPLWLALLVAPPIHMFRQLKGGYRLSRFGTLWRTAFLMLATTIAGSLFFAFLLWLEAE